MRFSFFAAAILCLSALEIHAQGACDHALRFSGNNSYVDCGPGSNFNVEGQLTVQAWVKLDQWNYPQYIAGNIDDSIFAGFQLGAQNGALFCAIRDSLVGTRTMNIHTIPDTVWTHIAFTYRAGGRFKGFVNGRLLLDVPASANRIGDNGNSHFVIGACPWNPDTFETHGWIDEVRIYNIERSISEIRRDMRTNLNGPVNGLVGYWQLTEGSGIVTADGSGNNHHGVLSGANLPVWQIAEGPYGAGANWQRLGAAAGPVAFPGTSVELNFPVASLDTFVLTRIDCAPNRLPIGGIDYTYPYWVVDRYRSTAPISFDQTYQLAPGSISPADSVNPGVLQLYHRDAFSINSWSALTTATTASAFNASVEFQSVGQTGQYMIGTSGTSILNGVQDAFHDESVRVFPNPATDMLKIVTDDPSIHHAQLILVDGSGRELIREMIKAPNESIEMDVRTIESGTYVLFMCSDGKNYRRKISIIH